ncbi:DUF2325 domain-containing protein [Piscinibacter sp. HJYY11]|nr:DUF2325 domain-containing protein [Piscinibacter sp. HJYY11]
MQAAAATGATVLSLPTLKPKAGSRRRRLWELDAHAHCPVVGVCLPLPALRRIVDKVLSGEALADDYELHCGVIAECRRRTPIADAVQRELDRRCMIALRQAALAKTTEGLAAWWQAASAGRDLAGAFWATLTHPRCTPELEHKVLGDVHMLQHQVGVARRVDLQHFEAVVHENGVLGRELAAAQQRNTRQADEHRQRHEHQQSQIVQLRAQLIGRDTLIASLRQELQTLEDAVPGLKARQALVLDNERLLSRLHDTERTLMQAQHELERARARIDELMQALQRPPQAEATPTGVELPDPAALADRAVLCVGGRPASVPVYRQLIERTGGRFLHHDGGEEDNPAQLDATLAAADLVICQTGCISHDAYWRVKDHCKRTGKRCVFVETPSTAGLKRALRSLVPVAESPPA